MDSQKISSILKKITDVKIAVYGDFCLDSYWIIDEHTSEVSVETGLPVRTVNKSYNTPGGAGNVVSNLATLNPAQIKVIGVVGNDMHGRELSAQLKALGADTSSLYIQTENFDTYTYLKRHVKGTEQSRIDFGIHNQRNLDIDQKILEALEEALQNYDAVIFNQQVTGSITNESFISQANELFKKYSDTIVMLDSRHFNGKFKNTYRKINDIEAAVLVGVSVKPEDHISITDVKKYGRQLNSQSQKPVFITCGNRGIISIDQENIKQVHGILLKGEIDTVGAGDTTISALTLTLAAGFSPEEAAIFSNFAAAVTVQKLYTTGTASPEEITNISQVPDYNYNSDLAASERSAIYIKNTEFEICETEILGKLGHIKYAVFDHDGTISSLRQGWEDVMEPVMIQAILGEKYNTIDAKSYERVRARSIQFIHDTTGIQTIYQMEGLVNLVREYGYVPEDQILNKFQYKEIYNNGLMEMVNKRTAKLLAGELHAEDFIMKGAVHFLKSLKDRGVKLFLASGTDAEDVRKEATLLGYDDLFDGGIYGALKDYTKFSKKMIIEKIIRDNHLEGNEMAVFGDGPDEIREGRRAGGISIGITSNELQRFGHNPLKRPRLVRAGAQLLIPDFSQHQKLITLLFQENEKCVEI